MKKCVVPADDVLHVLSDLVGGLQLEQLEVPQQVIVQRQELNKELLVS